MCVCVCVCAGKEARTRARAYTWALYLRLLAGSKVTGRAGLLSAQIESSSRSSGRSFLYNHLRISRRGLRVLRGAGSFGACGVQQMAQNCAIPAHTRAWATAWLGSVLLCETRRRSQGRWYKAE